MTAGTTGPGGAAGEQAELAGVPARTRCSQERMRCDGYIGFTDLRAGAVRLPQHDGCARGTAGNGSGLVIVRLLLVANPARCAGKVHDRDLARRGQVAFPDRIGQLDVLVDTPLAHGRALMGLGQ